MMINNINNSVNTDKLWLCVALAPYRMQLCSNYARICCSSMLTSGDYAQFYAHLICASLLSGLPDVDLAAATGDTCMTHLVYQTECRYTGSSVRLF